MNSAHRTELLGELLGTRMLLEWVSLVAHSEPMRPYDGI